MALRELKVCLLGVSHYLFLLFDTYRRRIQSTHLVAPVASNELSDYVLPLSGCNIRLL